MLPYSPSFCPSSAQATVSPSYHHAYCVCHLASYKLHRAGGGSWTTLTSHPDLGPSSLLGVAFPGRPLCAMPRTLPRTWPPALFSLCHPVVDTPSPCPVALSASSSFPGKQNSSFEPVATNLRDHTGFPRFLETQPECPGKPWPFSFQLSGISGESMGSASGTGGASC